MKRREALIAIGMTAMAFAGVTIPVNKSHGKDSKLLSDVDTIIASDNIVFHEDSLEDLIIERNNGTVITIPFSEIFDALEVTKK